MTEKCYKRTILTEERDFDDKKKLVRDVLITNMLNGKKRGKLIEDTLELQG